MYCRDLLIDDEGTRWLPGTPALRQRLYDAATDIDVEAYAIRNLGFARVRRRRQSILISLRPALVGRQTFEAICELLAEDEYERVVIEQPDEIGGIELFTTAEDALARICLSAKGLQDGAGTRFFAEEMSLARLNHPSRLGMKRLLRHWRAAHGEQGPDWRPGKVMPARSVVTSHRPGGRALVEHFGTGHQVYDACWTLLAIGNDLESQPDPLYGQSSAESYHRVSHSGQPTLELVEATISAPGRPPRRSRYERLLLPWNRRGTILVSATSVLRSRIVMDEVM